MPFHENFWDFFSRRCLHCYSPILHDCLKRNFHRSRFNLNSQTYLIYAISVIPKYARVISTLCFYFRRSVVRFLFCDTYNKRQFIFEFLGCPWQPITCKFHTHFKSRPCDLGGRKCGLGFRMLDRFPDKLHQGRGCIIGHRLFQ